MLFRSIILTVSSLVLLVAGYEVSAKPITETQVPPYPTPSVTRLANLATFHQFLPFIRASKLAAPVPSPTPKPSAVAPTPTSTGRTDPGANQLVNPCFDGTHNEDPPGWQQTSGWDVSMYKNPCGPYGTAGRINDPAQAGESGPDRDERIWQVVPGQGADLMAKMQCVHHFAYYTDMNIYGSGSPNGPWTLVWTPFTLDDCEQDEWGATVRTAETQLAHDFAYYKVEFAAMYAPVGPTSGGVKFTNAFFSSGD